MTQTIAAVQFDAYAVCMGMQVAAESSGSVVEDVPRPARDKRKVQSGN